jgi:hypothetical protein
LISKLLCDHSKVAFYRESNDVTQKGGTQGNAIAAAKIPRISMRRRMQTAVEGSPGIEPTAGNGLLLEGRFATVL